MKYNVKLLTNLNILHWYVYIVDMPSIGLAISEACRLLREKEGHNVAIIKIEAKIDNY